MALPLARTSAILSLLLAAIAPAAARADNPIPAGASVSISLGPPARECLTAKLCGDYGGHSATISWQVSCSGPTPTTDRSAKVDLWHEPLNAGGKPVHLMEIANDDPANPSGTDTAVIPAGAADYATVTVNCSDVTYDANSNETDWSGSATARSDTVRTPHKAVLAGFGTQQNSLCTNRPLGMYKSTHWLQAGQWSWLVYSVVYDEQFVLPQARFSGGNSAAIKGTRLIARGAGVHLTKPPWPDGLKNRNGGDLQLPIKPRKGGTLRMSASVFGSKTNTLKTKVLPKSDCR